MVKYQMIRFTKVTIITACLFMASCDIMFSQYSKVHILSNSVSWFKQVEHLQVTTQNSNDKKELNSQ